MLFKPNLLHEKGQLQTQIPYRMLYKPNSMKMVHAIIVRAFSVSVPNYYAIKSEICVALFS